MAAALGALAAPVRADTKRDAAVAEALFAEGRRLMGTHDYAAACAKFADSEALDPAPGTALNLASCYEKAEKLASAWAAYKTAQTLAQTAGQHDRAAAAGQRATALEAKISHLTIAVEASTRPAGLEIVMDNEPIGEAEWGMPLPRDGGDHTVEARAPGYKPWIAHVALKNTGQNATLEVPLLESEPRPPVPAEAAVVPEPQPAAAPPPPPSSGRSQRKIGLVVGGVGVAGVIFGAVAGLEASSKYSSAKAACGGGTACEPGSSAFSLRASAGDWATVSNVAFIAGGALAAAGVVLFLTAHHDDASPKVGLAPSPQGAGLSVWGDL